MQSIIIVAVTPAFMTALFGTAAACGLAGGPDFRGTNAFAPLLLVGSALYLVGTILLTIAYHVPLNKRWRESIPGTRRGREPLETQYLSGWTAWNHVRTAAALAAAAVLTIALHV